MFVVNINRSERWCSINWTFLITLELMNVLEKFLLMLVRIFLSGFFLGPIRNFYFLSPNCDVTNYVTKKISGPVWIIRTKNLDRKPDRWKSGPSYPDHGPDEKTVPKNPDRSGQPWLKGSFQSFVRKPLGLNLSDIFYFFCHGLFFTILVPESLILTLNYGYWLVIDLSVLWKSRFESV